MLQSVGVKIKKNTKEKDILNIFVIIFTQTEKDVVEQYTIVFLHFSSFKTHILFAKKIRKM
jgi:hypothetical protein